MRITCHILLAINIHEMAQKISGRVRSAPEDIRHEGLLPEKRPILVDEPGSTQAAPRARPKTRPKLLKVA
jgi:hypothetical protein